MTLLARAILAIVLAVCALALYAEGATAQGCGPQNPNCIVPTAPPGTNDNRAASTAFVQNATGGFSGFANPSALIGLTAVNGAATTAMRSDAAPALSQAISPTWTGIHTYTTTTGGITMTGVPNPLITDGNLGVITSFGNLAFLAANSETAPEGVASFNIISSKGAANPTDAFKIGLTASATSNPGSSNVWAQSNVVTLNAGGVKRGGIVYEADLNQLWAGNYSGSPSTPYAANFLATGQNTGGYANFAYGAQFAGNANPMWNYGFYAGPPGFQVFNTAAFFDESNSPTIFKAVGIHSVGIDLSGATLTTAIQTPFFSLNGTAGLSFAGTTSGTINIVVPSVAGTPTLQWPTGSGTFAVSASGCIALNTTTGALTSPTCATNALTSAHIFVGNGSNAATDVAMSGDISITNAGVTALVAGSASNLNSGTLPSGRLTGAYTGITGLGTIAGLTVTGSFTATGLVTNADLANASTTVNGQTCTLGSTCTVTAAATTITVGTTTVGSGTTTRILYDNAGVLGEYTLTGSGTVVVMQTSPTFVTAITTPIANLSGTSNQLVFQSGGVTGTISWSPATSNKTITLPNGSTDFTATGGTSQVLKQVSTGAALTVARLACADLSDAAATCSSAAIGSITGLGTGVATALAVNVGSAGAFVTFNGALGTPSSGTVTNLTGTASININGTVGATTPAAGTFTAAIANSFVPNLSTVPSNGMYLPAANTLGWAINSAAELQLTATALSPAADGGSSLGTTALGWQNLFGNTGFVINIEGGDWVATHTAGIVTVGTGDLRVTTAGTNTASVVTVGGTQTLTGKTLGAVTLGGTVSGGGNQINNVIIGTTTPLAGSFTTVTASDKVTAAATVGFYLGSNVFVNNTTSYINMFDNEGSTFFVSGSSSDPRTFFNNGSLLIRSRDTVTTFATFNSSGLTMTPTTDAVNSTAGALIVAGGASIAKRFWIPAITTSSGLQTAVLCQSSGGEMIADSVACLASAAHFKNVRGPMPDGALAKLMRLPIPLWTYKAEGNFQSDDWTRERIGPLADDVAAMDSRLGGYDSDGNVRTYSTEQLLGFTIKSLQEAFYKLTHDNDNLKEEIMSLKRVSR